jgi:hypothetical protein
VLHTMASMPFGMHAVQKVRANMNLTANATTNGSKRQKDNNINYKFSNDQCKSFIDFFHSPET